MYEPSASLEASHELAIVQVLRDQAMAHGIAVEEQAPEVDAWPSFHDAPIEYEPDSDTEDSLHEGDGIPCRAYNHNDCSGHCGRSHAPNDLSVRDELCVL
jgi:hypothetical protein